MDTRLIIDEPARGSWNMAVDEALLQSAGQGRGATLRFYRWSEPTLSLGYFQQIADRSEHSSSCSLPVVRRATGGGAIVHDRELTYSFVTPIRDRFSSGAHDLVRDVHVSLIATLSAFGIKAELFGDAATKPTSEAFLCFQRRNSLDIIVDAEKVVGSAQRRHQGALLQHGSILLMRSAFAEVLPGINDLSNEPLDQRELLNEWSQRLAKQFGCRYEPSSLTSSEVASAKTIEQGRFSNASWTEKR